MYKRARIWGFALTSLLAILILYCTFCMPITGENPSFKRVPTYSEELAQKRTGVTKEFIFNDGTERTCYQMECPTSEFFVQGTPMKRYSNFIEYADNLLIRAVNAPGLNASQTDLRGNNATFNYQERLLTLKHATVNHSTTANGSLQGRADHLLLDLTNKESPLVAEESIELYLAQNFCIKGDLMRVHGECIEIFAEEGRGVITHQSDTIYSNHMVINKESRIIQLDQPRGTIINSNNNKPIYFTAKSLIWDEPNGLISLRDEAHVEGEEWGSLYAQEKIDLKNKSNEGAYTIDECVAYGPIRFERKDELLATGDQMLYIPATRSLELSANPDKKVLFWDLASESTMRTDRLTIHRDPITNQDIIKGHGRVEFTFTQEEKDSFLTLFRS